MIPKTIHYCWFSTQPDSINPDGVIEKRCLNSWKRYAPDYEWKKWGIKEARLLKNDRLQKLLDAERWAFAADYVRLHALVEEGGWYFDVDFELGKKLETFPVKNNLLIGTEGGRGSYISVHALATAPGNPFLRDCLETLGKWESENGVPKQVILPQLMAWVFRQKTYDIELEKSDVVPIAPRFGSDASLGIHHQNASWIGSGESWLDYTDYHLLGMREKFRIFAMKLILWGLRKTGIRNRPD